MNVMLIIGAVLAVALVILLVKLVQGFLKILIYAVLIIIIGGAIFSYFAFRDSSDLAYGLSHNTTIFILKDNNTLITGFTVNKMNMTTAKSLDKGQLNELSAYYAAKDYKSMLGSYYKLVIIDENAFPKTKSFNPDDVISYLKGDKKELNLLTELVSEIKPDFIPDTKAMAFSLLVIYSIRNDPAYLVKEFRQGNVIIYPETLVFKALKFTMKGK